MGQQTVTCELILGPYDGRVGEVAFADEPPRELSFTLDDRKSGQLIVSAKDVAGDLVALYVRIDEGPRKIVTYDDNGRARSVKGARYKYDAKRSPCERVFETADAHAKLTAEAHEQVMQTRKLLLDKAQREREGASS